MQFFALANDLHNSIYYKTFNYNNILNKWCSKYLWKYDFDMTISKAFMKGIHQWMSLKRRLHHLL